LSAAEWNGGQPADVGEDLVVWRQMRSSSPLDASAMKPPLGRKKIFSFCAQFGAGDSVLLVAARWPGTQLFTEFEGNGMIVLNYLGLGVLILAMLVGYGVQGTAGNVGEGGKLLGAFSIVVAVCLFEVVYRWRQPGAGGGRFLMPSRGGHVMFLPVWVCSVLVAINSLLANL
jgi:hypothetical protein